jgi:hypothetical protein
MSSGYNPRTLLDWKDKSGEDSLCSVAIGELTVVAIVNIRHYTDIAAYIAHVTTPDVQMKWRTLSDF